MASDSFLSALVGTAIPTLIAVFGWWIAYRNELRRDREVRRRDFLIRYLTDAYAKIEYFCDREPNTENAPNLERAVSRIQLYGSPRQVELAQELAYGISKVQGQGEVPATLELLEDLRRELRAELKLAELEPDSKIVRVRYRERPGTR